MTWVGETTPHATQSWLSGYLVGTAIFGLVLVVLVWIQIKARSFNPWFYWATIVASTTAGTTLADLADRSLGIGYPGGSVVLLACVLSSLFAWRSTGTVDVNTVSTPRDETFYWIKITFSQTLGTALGDWIADSGPGYSGGALIFGAGLLMLLALYSATELSRVALFWTAFILTRPLDAAVGDFLEAGGQRRTGIQPPRRIGCARHRDRSSHLRTPAARGYSPLWRGTNMTSGSDKAPQRHREAGRGREVLLSFAMAAIVGLTISA